MTGKTATLKIIYDREWREYQVEVWLNGKKRKAATYHADDKADATDTAAAMAKTYAKKGYTVTIKGGGK